MMNDETRLLLTALHKCVKSLRGEVALYVSYELRSTNNSQDSIPVCRKKFLEIYQINKNTWEGFIKDYKDGFQAPKQLYVRKQRNKMSHKLMACVTWLRKYGDDAADRVPNQGPKPLGCDEEELHDLLVLDSCYRNTIWAKYVDDSANGNDKFDTLVSRPVLQ